MCGNINSLTVRVMWLAQSLKLETRWNAFGELPAGTVLYRYRELPEIATFVVFVNTKRLNALQVEPSGKAFLVDPAEAF